MHFTLLYSMSLDKNLASPRTLFAVAQSGLSNEGEKKKKKRKLLIGLALNGL